MQSNVVVRARAKAGKKPSNGKVDLNLIMLGKLYHLRQEDAARKLGISLTSLKTACRRLGLNRWPYTRAKAKEDTETAEESPRARTKFRTAEECLLSNIGGRLSTTATSSTADAAPTSSSGSSSTQSSAPKLDINTQSELELDSESSVEGVETGSEGGADTEKVSDQILDKKWIEWYMSADDSEDTVDLMV
eukprot:748201-Hanusia_phi.AAC.1